MKICFLADGESIHTVRWCRHFSSLGHEVHVISFKPASIEGTTVHHVNAGKIDVGGGNWKVITKVPEVKRIVRSVKPDVLHAHYATSYGLVGALAGHHPYVVTALGSDVLISPKGSFIYRMLLKYVFSKADWITAMAEHMREAILALGVPAHKVVTLPFGIDPAVFNAASRRLPEGKFVITSTRNFEDVYNHPHLINALALVRDKIPNLEVNLIGTGSKREGVERLVKEKKLDDIVTFHGRIPQPEIARMLNASHLFVTVSLSDGNNISLNEAMACGAYPIATRIPANIQWIEDGVNGMLVEINDVNGLSEKMLEAYRNYGELQNRAFEMNQRIIAERAIWSKNMEAMERYYQKLLRK